jgi:hypothetical protein
MAEDRKSDLFKILPWTGMPGNALGMPWKTRKFEEDGHIQIVNCLCEVIADTAFSAENRTEVIASNNYAVDVMNAVYGVRGNFGIRDAGIKEVSWDFESVRHVSVFREVMPHLVKWWDDAFKDKPWAKPLQPIVQPSWGAGRTPISETIQEFLGIGHPGESCFYVSLEKHNRISMAISTTDSDRPLITLRPLHNSKLLHWFKVQRDAAKEIWEALEWQDYLKNDVPISQLKAAAKQFKRAKKRYHYEVKIVAADEIVARNTAFVSVVAPTLNAFRSWDDPRQFPIIVHALRKGLPDLEAFGRSLHNSDPDSSRTLFDMVARLKAAYACFDELGVERNQEALRLPKELRHARYEQAQPVAFRDAAQYLLKRAKKLRKSRRPLPPVNFP